MKPLEPEQKKKLRSLLLGFYLDSQVILLKSDIAQLATDISIAFPKEDPNSYFNPNTKIGPLYSDHNNKVQALRKVNVLPASTSSKSGKKRKIDHLKNATTPIFVPTDQENQSDDLIKMGCHNSDLSTFLQHWKSSAKIRLSKINNLAEGSKVTSILQEYPAYKRSDCSMLVSYLNILAIPFIHVELLMIFYRSILTTKLNILLLCSCKRKIGSIYWSF